MLESGIITDNMPDSRNPSDLITKISLILLIVIMIFALLPLLERGITNITGAYDVSARANTTLTLSQEIGCDFVDDAIDFGQVLQDINNDSFQIQDNWTLQNTGTVNITVNVTVNTNNSAGWLFSTQQVNSDYWFYRCSDTKSGECNISSYAQVRFVANEIAVWNVSPSSDKDNITLQTNITVPHDEPSGSKSGTIRAECFSFDPAL